MTISSLLTTSAETDKITPALVEAMAKIHAPDPNKWRAVDIRTQGGGSFKFRYATLENIVEMLRPVLADHGLCVMQPVVTVLGAGAGGNVLLTRVLHESGQFVESSVALPSAGGDPQKFGSALTYMRRYSLNAMFNISGQDDDDGNVAAGHGMRDVSPRDAALRNTPPGPAPENRDAGEASAGGANALAIVAGTSSEALAAAKALTNRARMADSVADGQRLVAAWLAARPGLDTHLRGQPAWAGFAEDMVEAIRRVWGGVPADAFAAALVLRNAEDIGNLQRQWEGEWVEALGKMQADAPEAYALLRRHVATQIARARGTGSATASEETGSAAA